MIIAITGHRPEKFEDGYTPGGTGEVTIKAKLREALLRLRPEGLVVGMALGVDQWAAEVAAECGIKFIAAVPFEGQERIWPEASQERYKRILKMATSVKVVCTGGYEAWKMEKRNEWMVDQCDLLLAVWDGSKGGTANCVNYAQGRNKQIEFIRWKNNDRVRTSQ